ncbi:ABC transporter substrate-binding protein [Acididesulfobacillus acetoxydans]|nr:ABC transporter substrate-binding protein [Acididesulfobacillus acetoxydans]
MYKRASGLARFPGWLSLISVILLLLLSGCASVGGMTEKPQIVFGDASWDSAQIHDRVAGFIIEHGYGHPVAYQFGDTIPLLEGLSKGDIQVMMEVWYQNFQTSWRQFLKSGTVKDLGSNYSDAPQGWYVPTYLIKGDPARGIAPMAPDLKSVSDLAKYWNLFKDPEDPSKGRFYNAPSGWAVSTIDQKKMTVYGLDKYFKVFDPGSQTALDTSLLTAYQQGKPWVGYYWAPTWILGKLNMTLLAEPPYSATQWKKNYGCAFPPAPVHKAINSKLASTAPDVVSFLEKYHTTLDQTSAALAYMHDHNSDPQLAAIWYLRNYPNVWKQWVPADVATRVTKALSEVK